MMRELHILNLGAGVQSTFLYLAFMRRMMDLPVLDAAIFADPQDEPEDVYAHLQWLKALNGPPIFTGTAGRLGDHLQRGTNSTGQRFASIPAFTTDGESEGRVKRQCTAEYKISVIGKVLRRQILGLKPGRSPRGVRVHQYFGISLDEAGRAGRISEQPCPRYVVRHFPLIEKFITRANCEAWLKSTFPEHPVPRSACVFCPFHSDDEWLRIKQNPRDWARAVEIDEALRTTGSVANRDMKQTMYLHRSMKPLVQIDFQPSNDPRKAQSNINFAPECMGGCGV